MAAHGRRWGAWLGNMAVIVAAVAGGASALAGDAPTGTYSSPPVENTIEEHWVTLVTGDRVMVDAAEARYEFHPAAGREQMSHRSMAVDGHRYVIPSDAQVLVGSGQLDLRLFDVTALRVRDGGIPLLVTRDRGTSRVFATPADAARRWAELTEPVPAERGHHVGSRRFRVGVHAVGLDRPHPARPAAAADVELTFVYRDRDGARAASARTVLAGPDGFLEFVAPGPDGTATVRVPRGHYIVDSGVETPRPGKEAASTSVIVNPDLNVERDTRVVVDAATAKPVSVTVPDPKAVALLTYVSYRISSRDGGFVTNDLGHRGMAALYVAHDGPTLPDDMLDVAVTALFARPGPTGTLVDSPVTYAASWQQQGRFYTGFRKRVTAAELSTVRAEHAATVPGRRAAKSIVAEPFSSNHPSFELEYTTAPFTRVEHYAGTAKWANNFQEYVPGDTPDPRDRTGVTSQTQKPTTYRPGRDYSERWNLAPLWPDPQVRRFGDTMSITPALYSDQSGRRTGYSAYQRAHVALYRDANLIGQSDQLERSEHPVPAGPATYRLTIDAERQLADLAGKVSGVWTFTSAHVEGEGQPLGLMSVRFAPPVDVDGQASEAPVHVFVERPVPGPAVHSLTLRVSYDGGTTWKPVRVTGTGDKRVAVIRHPTGSSTVSLHATATDAHGNTVEQTIINAYR